MTEMKSLWDRSLDNLSMQIKHLESINLASTELKIITEHVKRLAHGYPMIKGYLPLEYVYRARIAPYDNPVKALEHPFSEVAELWYPPSETIKNYGRINNIGQSIFYCSNNLDTALLEVRPTAGDIVTVLKCKKSNQPGPIVMQWDLLEYAYENHQGSPMANARQNAVKDKEKYSILRSFLNREFTKLVDTTHEHEYKITVAIAGWLLSDYFLFVHDSLPPAEGIVYQSIAWNRGFNIALKPEAADKVYEPVSAQIFHIIEKISDTEFKTREITRTTSIVDEQLQWDDVLLYHNRGSLRGQLGDHSGAESDYSKAIRLGKYNKDILKNRADARWHLNNFSGAESDLSKALTFDRVDVDIYVKRGLSRLKQKRYVEAFNDFEEAIKLEDTDGEVLFLCGLCEYYLEKYRQAYDYFTNALDNDFNSAIIHKYLNDCEIQMED